MYLEYTKMMGKKRRSFSQRWWIIKYFELIFSEIKIVGEEKKKELVIPLKKPSWIEKAKERIAKEQSAKEEKNVQNKEASPITQLDEARMSLLKGLMEDTEARQYINHLILCRKWTRLGDPIEPRSKAR